MKITAERPLRLNFVVDDERIGRFTKTNAFVNLAVSKKRKDKKKIAEQILFGKEAQAAILKVLERLKRDRKFSEIAKDRQVFEDNLSRAFKDAGIDFDKQLKDALLAPGSLGERDSQAEACIDTKGNLEADPELRDTENVPLPEGITLPLPLDYEGKKSKGKVDNSALLELVREHCEAYLRVEVLPYRSDAWIDHAKTKVGYEIPFNRHFYQYEPPRPLEDIEADIEGLERKIMAMLKEVV